MLIFNRQADISAHLLAIPNPKSIGLVPTMGALHAGHISLLEKSMQKNSITVISIFVNPTQFNNPDDLAKYPRTFEADIEKIEALSSEIIVFAPSVEDIYDGKTVAQEFDFDGLEDQMEGKFRPGHFDGVGTIVMRLFEIVRPDYAYFGQKDFQQLQIVRKMVSKYGIPVKIVGCPIHREANGLAMSSRNERLSADERNEAAFIYQALKAAKRDFKTQSVSAVSKNIERIFAAHPNFELEYFEIADEETLKPIGRKNGNRNYRAFIATFVNKIRLIDTIALK